MPAINKTKASADRIKMKIRKGDTVQIISGKDKGKTGEVLKTLPYENRVLVQGINQLIPLSSLIVVSLIRLYLQKFQPY